MEIVKDVNVSKLPVFDLEEFDYYEFLWERIFGDGGYIDNDCDEAVGFNSGRSCSAEFYKGTMIIRFTKIITDETSFMMTANYLANSIAGTENLHLIDRQDNGVVIDLDDSVYLSILADFNKQSITINAYKKLV